MKQTLNIRNMAKKVTDLSTVGFDLGFPFNNCGNFSLLPMPNGFWFAYMRIFAYWIDAQGRYLTNNQVLLKNPANHQFCVLDKDFNFVKKIPNTVSEYWKHPQFSSETPYMEDGRLVVWNGKVYLSTTVCYQKDGCWNAAGLEVQRLDFQGDTIRASHVWNTIEQGIAGIQKNWLPVPDKPMTYIVGTSDHGAQHIDISSKDIVDVGQIDKNVLYRGNTPLVKVDGGYLAIVHGVIDVDEQHKIKTYYNHFVKYDNDLLPVAFSRAFKLTNREIEFVTYLNFFGDEVQIGVTENDDTPVVLTFDRGQLFNEIGILG